MLLSNQRAINLTQFSTRIQKYSTQLFNLTWKNRKNNVFVVGGTHGNEPTGVQLVNYYNSYGSESLKSRNFGITALLANPRAILRNSRYYDVDLNRCFTLKELNSPNNHHLYEPMRASHVIIISNFLFFFDKIEKKPTRILILTKTI